MRTFTFFLILFYLSLNIPTILSAQSNEFVPGYYITLKQDTVRGYIQDRSKVNQSNSFLFKADIEQKDTRQLTPSEVWSYYYSPDFYFKAQKITLGDKQEQRFLQKLVEGYAELYQDNSLSSSIYILEKKSGERIQLEKKDTITQGRLKPDKDYVGQIMYLFRDCKALLKNAPRMNYTQSSLARIVHNYNKCAHTEQESHLLTTSRKLNIKPGIQLGFTNFNSGSSNILDKGKSDGFAIGLILELSYFRRLSLRTGLNYYSYNTEASFEYSQGIDVFKYMFNIMEVPLTIKYQFGNRKIDPYLYGGINLPLQFKLRKNSTRIEQGEILRSDDQDIFSEQYYFIGVLGVGTNINLTKDLDVLLNFEYDYKAMFISTNENIYPQRLTLSAGIIID